jgi:hypothetical protein
MNAESSSSLSTTTSFTAVGGTQSAIGFGGSGLVAATPNFLQLPAVHRTAAPPLLPVIRLPTATRNMLKQVLC